MDLPDVKPDQLPAQPPCSPRRLGPLQRQLVIPFARTVAVLAGAALLATVACAPQAAAPTAAPSKPAPTAAPAQPAPTTAPAKVEAPSPKPAPTAAPAAKPTEKPAAKPEAKPAQFDEKTVADFYKGKTIRIVVGFAPGGATDVNARLAQKVVSRYIPGNPAVVVENKPGGGGLLAANTLYNAEPRDGTVVGAFNSQVVLQQAIGAQGVQYDTARLNWLGSGYETAVACAARTDSGIASVQDIMEGGKEFTVASYGKGTNSYDPPAAMNAALGAHFKIVTGYEGGPSQRLAVQNKEVQGYCTSVETMTGEARAAFEGTAPQTRIIIIMGSETPNHPFLKGVPAAETLAKSQEAKAMLRAVHAPGQINQPFALTPEVPRDRVEALRRAWDRAYADPELLAAAEKAQLVVNPKTGEQVTRIVQEILNTPPATLAKLQEALK